MKLPRKKWRESLTKLKEVNNSIKELQENWEQTLVQDLKIKIEAIMKTQMEGILKKENLVKWTGTTDTRFKNRMQGWKQEYQVLKTR